MTLRVLAPGTIAALKETLRSAFWYKNDLRRFLLNCGVNQTLIGQLDWDHEYKRTLISQLIDGMSMNPQLYSEELLEVAVAVAKLGDPTWLLKVQGNGKELHDEAVERVRDFAARMKPIIENDEANRAAETRKVAAEKRQQTEAAMAAAVVNLKSEFSKITQMTDAQSRGYAFEKFLTKLFQTFDITTRGSYKINDEQIDGAFTLDNMDYLLEAKWQSKPIDAPEVVIFSDKVDNKLDNTLGVFISMSGFTKRAINNNHRHRPNVLLMDGSDLAAILDRAIDLPELIAKKKIHAAQTGEIMISAFQLVYS